MRVLRTLIVPALGVMLGALVLVILDPAGSLRSAQAEADDLAKSAALAGAVCIDEAAYARDGAFTGMPLDAACANERVHRAVPGAQPQVLGGDIVVTVDSGVRMRGITVPGLVVHGHARAHAEYLEAS